LHELLSIEKQATGVRSMAQQQKHNMSGIGSARLGRVNNQTITEVLSLWLPAIIVGLLILGAFPF
jgi:hypothetical protein